MTHTDTQLSLRLQYCHDAAYINEIESLAHQGLGSRELQACLEINIPSDNTGLATSYWMLVSFQNVSDLGDSDISMISVL